MGHMGDCRSNGGAAHRAGRWLIASTPRLSAVILTIVVNLSNASLAHAQDIFEGALAPAPAPQPQDPGHRWTGLYLGLSTGQNDSVSEVTTSQTQTIPGEPVLRCSRGRCQETGLFTNDAFVTTFTDVTLTDLAETTGGFAGLRYGLGPLVAGAELEGDGSFTKATLQAGLALGPVLFYGAGGVAEFAETEAEIYGGGIDVLLFQSIMLGLSYDEGTFGRTALKRGTLRLGWHF